MNIQGQVGNLFKSASASPGAQPFAPMGNTGELLMSELHGRYYSSAYNGLIFGGAAAGITTSAGLVTGYTGLALTNPIGSGVNIVLNKVGFSFIVAFAAGAAIGLASGYNAGAAVTQTTPITPRNKFLNGASGKGLLASSVTFPTAPTLDTIFGAGDTGAITTSPGGVAGLFDLEGSDLIPPGGYICIYTSTASGASGFYGSFSWEELPI